jgi:ERCC4-related helicase
LLTENPLFTTAVSKHDEEHRIQKWCDRGGLLLINVEILASKVDHCSRPELIESVFKKAHLAVLDECHKFIGSTKLVKLPRLCQFKTNRRIGLSGSPIQNDIGEIYEIMSWVVPGVLGSNRQTFINTFVHPIEQGLDPDATPTQRRIMQLKLQILKNELAPIICRRSPKFLASILSVAKAEFIIRSRASRLQQQLLEEYAKETQLIFDATNAVRQIPGIPEAFYEYQIHRYLQNKYPKKGSPNLEKSAAVLRMIRLFDKIFSSFDPNWKPWVESSSYTKSDSMRLTKDVAVATSPKFQFLLEVVKEAAKVQDKVVVFTHWKETQTLLLHLFKQVGILADGFSGTDSQVERAEKVEAFKPGSLIQVFVATTSAGAHGINLIAANRVVLFEPVWNPATEVQAAFRVFRIGQTKDVFIYHLISAATGEKFVEATSLYKKKLSVRFLDEVYSKMESEVKDKKLSVKTIFKVEESLVYDPKAQPFPKMAEREKYSDVILNKLLAHPETSAWIHNITPSELLIADDADELIPDDVRTDAASKKVVDMLTAPPEADESRPKRGRPRKKGAVAIFNPASPGGDDVEEVQSYQIPRPSSPQRPNPTIRKISSIKSDVLSASGEDSSDSGSHSPQSKSRDSLGRSPEGNAIWVSDEDDENS